MLNYVENEYFVYKFDIKQGYYHIDIKSEHQRYLGFPWEINGKVHYFVFIISPIGLISAPFIFSKTMRVLVKYCRENNVKICCFLDGGAGMEVAFHMAFTISEFLRNSKIQSWFVVNQEKPAWYPTIYMT